MRSRSPLLPLFALLVASCAPPAERVDLLVEGVTVHRGDGGEPLTADVAVRDGLFLALDGSGERRFEALLDELEMLQDSGISAAAILPMATSDVARSLGVEARTGVIAAEMEADFLLLSGDPAGDVRHLRDPVVVVQKGQVVWPGEGPAGQ